MLKRCRLIALPLFLGALSCAAPVQAEPRLANQQAKYEYTRIDSIEVKGRQGVASDGNYYYVSGSKALYKYDKNGKLLLANEKPFEGYPIAANHIGGIDVFNGEIFVSAENFMDGVGKDIQIAIHDADTLKLKRTFSFEPSSGQQEVSGICVDTDKRTVWMVSWVGEESGRYIYEYSLDTGKYLRKVHLQPVPQWIQGIHYWKGKLFVTADDGTADLDEPDNLYRVDVTDKSYAPVIRETAFVDVKRQGEIEAGGVDPKTGELLVLFNRGSRIVLGMVKGFYPGYDREISEVYRYKMTPVGEKHKAAKKAAAAEKK
jgi:outer membrane protein assembly factor BamB